MPRIRSLKHDFFLDEVLAECDLAARILFAGLWVIADKGGRLKDQPIKIKAQLLPYDTVDCDALLTQLADHRLIIRYKVGPNSYIQIRSFSKHQKPHPKEPESEIPAPANSQKQKPLVPTNGRGSFGADMPCVYFIQPKAGGLVKIGFAQNVKIRLAELQTGCPVRLTVLGVIPATIAKERELHQRFAALRQQGEWFELSAELAQFIKENTAAVKLHGRAAAKNGAVELNAGMVNGSGDCLGDPSTSGNGAVDLGVEAHTHGFGGQLVCVPKSKFSLEQITQYAWAAQGMDERLRGRGERNVEGIRNPVGWAVAAHRSGEFDKIIQEWVDDPSVFGIAS